MVSSSGALGPHHRRLMVALMFGRERRSVALRTAAQFGAPRARQCSQGV